MYDVRYPLGDGKLDGWGGDADLLAHAEVGFVASDPGVGSYELRFRQVGVVPNGGTRVPLFHGIESGATRNGGVGALERGGMGGRGERERERETWENGW